MAIASADGKVNVKQSARGIFRGNRKRVLSRRMERPRIVTPYEGAGADTICFRLNTRPSALFVVRSPSRTLRPGKLSTLRLEPWPCPGALAQDSATGVVEGATGLPVGLHHGDFLAPRLRQSPPQADQPRAETDQPQIVWLSQERQVRKCFPFALLPFDLTQGGEVLEPRLCGTYSEF